MKIVGHPKWTDDRYDFIDGTVKEIDGLIGGDFGNSSEERENSSELRNLSSEVSFHSSELLFPGSVGNFRLLGGGSQFPREKSQSAEMPASLQSKSTALYSEVLATFPLDVIICTP